MKKLFIILLCLMAVLAIVSCKQDPKTGQKSEPAATDDDVLSGKAYYRLTATRTAKRFALQYYDDESDGLDPQPGDVLTLKYRSNHSVDRFYLRDISQKVIYVGESGYHDILAVDDPYVSAADEDGWITLTFTFSEGAGTGAGFRLELCNYAGSKFAQGDYLELKDLEFKGEKLTIEEDEDEDASPPQSNHGVWNNTNTDHTLPTLEVVFF